MIGPAGFMAGPKAKRVDKKPAESPTPDQIRAAREAADLTQTEAAALIGKSWRTWQNWEAPVGTKNHRSMDPVLFKAFNDEVAQKA